MGIRIASPFSLVTNRSGNEALPASSFWSTTKSPPKKNGGKFDAGIDR